MQNHADFCDNARFTNTYQFAGPYTFIAYINLRFMLGETFQFLNNEQVICHTRSAKAWTAVSTFIRSQQQDLGDHTDE